MNCAVMCEDFYSGHSRTEVFNNEELAKKWVKSMEFSNKIHVSYFETTQPITMDIPTLKPIDIMNLLMD